MPIPGKQQKVAIHGVIAYDPGGAATAPDPATAEPPLANAAAGPARGR